MAEVGSAYLTVFPKAPGFERELGRETDGAFDGVGRRGGQRLGEGVEKGGKGSFLAAGKGLAGAFAGAFAALGVASMVGSLTRAVTDFASDAIGAATDLGETMSKTGEIFGDWTVDVEQFADAAAKDLGQSKRAALDAASTFGFLGKAIGLTSGENVDFSLTLTRLASDLASFGNTSPEDAVVALGAALRGESEPIRAYGVLLDDATLKNRALAEGLIENTKNSLTPQQRAMAAYKEILAQTTTQQGDFARTSDSLANQQRVAAAEVENLKAQIGEALLPAAQKLMSFFLAEGVPTLQKLADWFTENEEAITDFAMKSADMALLFVQSMFSMAAAGLNAGATVMGAFRSMTDVLLRFLEANLEAADKAFGWLPGVGEKLRTAKADVAAFRGEATAGMAAIEAGTRQMAAQMSSGANAVAGLRSELKQLNGTQASFSIIERRVLPNGRLRIDSGPEMRAAGGPVERNTPYWVGEYEPELFVPDRPGTILNGAQIRAAVGQGGGSGPVMNVYPQAGQDEVTIGRVAADQLTWAARR